MMLFWEKGPVFPKKVYYKARFFVCNPCLMPTETVTKYLVFSQREMKVKGEIPMCLATYSEGVWIVSYPIEDSALLRGPKWVSVPKDNIVQEWAAVLVMIWREAVLESEKTGIKMWFLSSGSLIIVELLAKKILLFKI